MEQRFFRVTDGSSADPYRPRYGFAAGITRSRINLVPGPNAWTEKRRLIDAIIRHLDWNNRDRTHFVSVDLDYETAVWEARRRMRAGMQDVILWEIRVPEDDNEGWRMWKTVNRLKRELGFWIEDKAFHRAKYEALFLHRIPQRYVFAGRRFTDHRGRKFAAALSI